MTLICSKCVCAAVCPQVLALPQKCLLWGPAGCPSAVWLLSAAAWSVICRPLPLSGAWNRNIRGVGVHIVKTRVWPGGASLNSPALPHSVHLLGLWQTQKTSSSRVWSRSLLATTLDSHSRTSATHWLERTGLFPVFQFAHCLPFSIQLLLSAVVQNIYPRPLHPARRQRKKQGFVLVFAREICLGLGERRSIPPTTQEALLELGDGGVNNVLIWEVRVCVCCPGSVLLQTHRRLSKASRPDQTAIQKCCLQSHSTPLYSPWQNLSELTGFT